MILIEFHKLNKLVAAIAFLKINIAGNFLT